MKIDIIVPCYNEEEVLPWSVGKLQEVAAKLRDTVQAETRLLFVDDGSRDNTWNLIREYAEKYENVSGIKLSHNEGHQNAL
jgi:glycosyltransferase involved in cell wall biosynthesis